MPKSTTLILAVFDRCLLTYPNEVLTILEQQLDDNDVSKIIAHFENFDSLDAALRWTDRVYYLSQDVLYRCAPDVDSKETQLLVLDSFRAELMKELHDAPNSTED